MFPHNHLCLVTVPPGNPIIEAKDEVLSEGNETEMTCTAMSSKPAATIRWMKGDKELTGGPTETQTKEKGYNKQLMENIYIDSVDYTLIILKMCHYVLFLLHAKMVLIQHGTFLSS